MDKYTKLATDQIIEKTKKNLEQNGINVMVANNADEAKKIIFSKIPEGAEVMTATSTTLKQLGIETEINESGKFDAIKPKLMKMDRNTQGLEMQKLGAAPEYVIGSVHAVTEDGKVIIASNTGSQMASYVYGASHVIWVVSTKKIVKNLDEGLKRINEHILPLEDKRLKEQYGPQAVSMVRKILIVNSEVNPKKTTLIFVKEDLGF